MSGVAPSVADIRPPAILLGGSVNALSIARSLGRAGVTVYGLNAPDAEIRHSRYARWLPQSPSAGPDDWLQYLLSPRSEHLRGAVLLAASDAAVALLATHRAELSDRYRLDCSDPAAQLCMLDKLCTYSAAVEAGVPTPRFWPVFRVTDVEALRSELVYPLVVKPRHSEPFGARFGRKYFVANTFDEACRWVDTASAAGVGVLLMEMIPGPDDRLCSYNTYLDEAGNPQFEFTKRVIRRYPVNMGAATYHVTDHIPELREPALRLFRHVGLRGLANAEFKYDERDGQLKLIECNARFIASQPLFAKSGFDLGTWVYERAVGRVPPSLTDYPDGLHLWSPVADLRAFVQLRSRGDLTTRRWLASLVHPQTFATFDWRDPAPSAVGSLKLARAAIRRVERRVGSALER